MNPNKSFDVVDQEEDKAGYNQAGEIARTLANLRNTFVSATMDNNFKIMLEVCRATLNIISGKIPVEQITKLDKRIYDVEDLVGKATMTHREGGIVWVTNPEERKTVKKTLEKIMRRLERLQDKYGYGMYSAEDPKKAIYK